MCTSGLYTDDLHLAGQVCGLRIADPHTANRRQTVHNALNATTVSLCLFTVSDVEHAVEVLHVG